MKIRESVALSTLTTMRIGGNAKFVVEISSSEELIEATAFAKMQRLPWFAMGGGSNIVANGDYDGVVILNEIRGFREIKSDKDTASFRIGSGEILDETIREFVSQNLSGAELLSRIPGTIGATPVQNVGAYGVEISQILTELTAYNIETQKFETLRNSDCAFAYRSSIFKSQISRKYIITDVTLTLSKHFLKPPFYGSLQKYLLGKHPELADGDNFRENVEFSPSEIRDAVSHIREDKLPDPKQIPSAGSFFKNPIVDSKFAKKFLQKNPDSPHFPMSNNQVKLAAGWLIDQTGLKGFANFGFQVYPKNALVITHIGKSGDDDLAAFKAEIVEKVREKFGITLEQEPEIL